MIRLTLLLFTIGLNAQGFGIVSSISNQGEIKIPQVPDIELKAFPSAVGYGKYTSGGRGQTVRKVTTLSPTGASSLGEVVDVDNTIVVFDVGGVIDLGGGFLTIDADNITIDFATAPGEGIEIQNGGLDIHGSNVILRNAKIRSNTSTSGIDGLRIRTNDGRIEGVVIDRCSVYYGNDENISITGHAGGNAGLRDVTIMRSIFSNPMGSGYSCLIGLNSHEISLAYNLSAFAKDRNIYSSYNDESFEMVNNVIYDWEYANVATYGETSDRIGNVFKDLRTPINTNIIRHDINVSNAPDALITDSYIHGSDNIHVSNGWTPSNGFYESDFTNYNQPNRVMLGNVVEPLSSDYVFDFITGTGDYGAGATPWNRDVIDSQTITHVINGTGSAKSTVSFLDSDDFLNPSSSTRPGGFDTDGDGMEDVWETTKGFEVGLDDSWYPYGQNGYTRFDAYLGYLNNEAF